MCTEAECFILNLQVEKINALEPQMQQLSDEQLRDKTQEFRSRLKSGTKLDDLIPEAFAVSHTISLSPSPLCLITAAIPFKFKYISSFG